MANLLRETKKIMEEIKKTPRDIAWIGSEDGEYVCDWKTFKKLANVIYDNDYGAQEVACDLVIVFKDGSWLERAEYDGAEWWEHRKTPSKKEKPKEIKSLLVGDQIGWCTLKEIHGEEETL